LECRQFAGVDDDPCVLYGPETPDYEGSEPRRLFPEMTVKGPSDEDIAGIEFSDEEEEEKKG